MKSNSIAGSCLGQREKLNDQSHCKTVRACSCFQSSTPVSVPKQLASVNSATRHVLRSTGSRRKHRSKCSHDDSKPSRSWPFIPLGPVLRLLSSIWDPPFSYTYSLESPSSEPLFKALEFLAQNGADQVLRGFGRLDCR